MRMDRRIPVTQTTQKRLLDLCRGLDLNYDEAINYLISRIVKPNEDPIIVGRRLRDVVQKNETRSE